MHLVAIDLTGRDPELVADRCWQAGASALWEVDETTIRVGVEATRLERLLSQLADLDPVDVSEAEAVELAGRECLVEVAGRQVELWVPATVFGDGTHPTTATCLALLPTAIDASDRVLDVGCGAGALSIGAALLGATVVAIDVEPDAVQATADNARRNEVAVATSSTLLADVDGSFDVVVANMTAGSLAPLVPDLLRCTRAGGSLLVSGMLDDQWPEIRDAIGGTVEDVRIVDGWVTALVTATQR